MPHWQASSPSPWPARRSPKISSSPSATRRWSSLPRSPRPTALYEKALGATIDWRKFDSGADVIAAIASGALDIGYVGSSPLAAAASRELPIETIFVVGLIGESEALVARNGSGVEKIADLAGKKVAVPFVSTTHYSLLAALKHEGVDPKSVEILNLRPPEIAAAWERGDIDAAYVWDPALGQIQHVGQGHRRLRQSGRMGRADLRRLDRAHRLRRASTRKPSRGFVKVTGDVLCGLPESAGRMVGTSPEQAAKIAKLTGAKLEDVPLLLKGYVFPTLADQASREFLGGETVKAVAATSDFLKEQGKIDAVLPDYCKYVSAKYVEPDALASN